MSDTEKVQALQRQIEQLQLQNRLSGAPDSSSDWRWGQDSVAFAGPSKTPSKIAPDMVSDASSETQGDEKTRETFPAPGNAAIRAEFHGKEFQREELDDEEQDGEQEWKTSPSGRVEKGRGAFQDASQTVAWNVFLSQWISSGWPELDAILPGAGFRRGSLVEWFAQTEASSGPVSAPRSPLLKTAWGHGAGLMALRVARELCRSEGILVILDQVDGFYPPTAAAWGLDLKRLIWLRVKEAKEAFWALDQALRCPAVRAVWCCLGNWDVHLDGRWFRRFQLAAEACGSVGLLVRSAAYRGRPSWAELQLEVTPSGHDEGLQRVMEVKRVRCRGRGYQAASERGLGGDAGRGRQRSERWLSDEPVARVCLEKCQEHA